MIIVTSILASILFAGIGGVFVVGFGLMLRRWILRRASLPVLLAVSHAVIVVTSITLYPTYIFCVAPPFDDMYWAFMLVPGIHIYWLGYWLGGCVDHYLHSSLIVLLIIPGIVCLILGTLQWYLLGHLWQRLRPNPQYGVRPRGFPVNYSRHPHSLT
ncbi:MAG: hypothetical protein WCH99_09020 [Verrucomicrobiota bacterium]